MKLINPTDCLLVMGRRGCGKSYLGRRLQALWPKRVVIDVVHEYKSNDFENSEIVNSFDKFTEKLIEFKKNNSKKFVLIYQFDPESPVSEEVFDHIMRVCYYFGNIQVVIEEIQDFCTPHHLPLWLKNCLLTGRHKGLSLLFTTQRPGTLNKTALSQCRHIFCGNIIEGNDLRYVSSFLNQDARRLSSLPVRRFLYFRDGEISEIENDFKIPENKSEKIPKNKNK